VSRLFAKVTDICMLWLEGVKKIQTEYICQLEGMTRGFYCYSYGLKSYSLA